MIAIRTLHRPILRDLRVDQRQYLLPALIIGMASLMLSCLAAEAWADGNPLNGTGRRPFYIFAHNPNTLDDVKTALAQGANALEPDITLAVDHPCGSLNPSDSLVDWDSSFPMRDGSCSDTKLVAWLDGVHKLAFDNNLALIVFDIKSSAATPANGRMILDAIKMHLNIEGINVNVILSVATKDDLAVFDDILKILGQREGVMVDSEDDAGAVVNYFFTRGYRGNIGYGDGTSGVGPHLVTAMDGAVWLRATTGVPKSVTYVYTINVADSMRTFIDAGVDGIITGEIPRLMGIVRGRSDIRLATRQDNPFQPLPEAYGLMIRTRDDGTDANITFTLEGSYGEKLVTAWRVKAAYRGGVQRLHFSNEGVIRRVRQ